MWLFPWASYAAIVGMLAILVAMALTPGQAKDLYFSLVTLVLACARTWSCAAAVRAWHGGRSRRELNTGVAGLNADGARARVDPRP